PRTDVLSEKELSAELYAVARQIPVGSKELFTALYQVLIGKNQGPRLAGFMKVIGTQRLHRMLSVY
ncbi:lysine--tRNA ligase, partial [Treponema pallidum]